MIGVHGGFNTGFYINEATNFGFQDWLNLYISSKNNCENSKFKCLQIPILDFTLTDGCYSRRKFFIIIFLFLFFFFETEILKS